MDPDALLVLVRYHVRSNERILETTALLSENQFREPANLDHGTAFQTLLHMIDVDWSWREFCVDNDVDGSRFLWEVTPLTDLRSIREEWDQEHARLLAYAGALDEQDLAAPMVWKTDDEPLSVPRWLVLAHVVNHGTQHRSEMARYLTECGHSPGDLDLL